jgi:hypothetical protein
MPSIRPRACSNTFSAGTGSSPPLGWIIAELRDGKLYGRHGLHTRHLRDAGRFLIFECPFVLQVAVYVQGTVRCFSKCQICIVLYTVKFN